MTFYLAHNFAAKDWLRQEFVPKLEALGHKVNARWLQPDEHEGDHTVTTDLERQKFAMEDFLDVSGCDWVIHFVDQFGGTPGKGKFIEVGYSLAYGKRVLVYGIGCNSSVFYFMPHCKRLKHESELLKFIAALPRG